MATTYYRLRIDKQDAAGFAPLYLVYQANRKRSYYAVGERLKPEQWDTSKERVRKQHPHAAALNGFLARLAEAIQGLALESKARGELVTPQALKEALAAQERPYQPPSMNGPHLLECMAQFIEATTPHRRPNTIKTYRTLALHLASFTKGKPVELKEVGISFANDFRAYLTTQGLTSISAAKVVAVLKRFLTWARDDAGFATAANVPGIRVKRPKATALKIALTLPELEALAALEMPKRPGLMDARDVFLFACFTGLRFSDIEHLRPEDIKGDKLQLVVVKTRDRLNLPLMPAALAILKKHEGRYPLNALPVVSNQKFNAHLKELGQLAGLDGATPQVKYIGSTRQDTTVPKWQLLTTHVARRTFATLSLEKGMQPAVLQKLLGHADIRQTMQYVKLTETALETELLRVWK